MARKKKAQGLGDTVENILEVTGIAKVAKFVMGEDCKCEERKQKLNALFPYRNTNCLTEDEYNFLDNWFSIKKYSVIPSEQTELIKIYNRVFNKKQPSTNCSSCMRDIINQLERVYNEYGK